MGSPSITIEKKNRVVPDADAALTSPTSPITAVYVLWMVLWTLVGVLEGYAMNKIGLAYPSVLVGQFTFQNWVVMKLFLSAAGFSMLLQSAMAAASPETFDLSRSYGRESFGSMRVLVGSSCVGAGMALAGSGPTMFAPYLGAKVDPWPLLAGTVAGAVVVAAGAKLQPGLKACPTEAPSTVRLEEVVTRRLGTKVSYSALAAGLGCVLLVCALGLEGLVPYGPDIAPYIEGELEAGVAGPWPPVVAGLLIGAGQVSFRYVTRSGMGGTTGVYALVSLASGGKLAPFAPADMRTAMQQLFYNYGLALLGSFLATETWEQRPDAVGLGAARTFCGAFLCVFGALFGGGCTCGHGITGTSELSIESFGGACGIFAGAVSVGYLIQAVL